MILFNAPQMADFLREGAELAQKGGFKGLIAFADEAQNFIDHPSAPMHQQIEQLRMFVHAFRTQEAPMGLFWGLTDRVEEQLFEQAGDMMQRVQDYGAFLKLQGAYTREFPRRLWEHLMRVAEAKEIVDEATLEALGQISERDDLSNGPRTVIAAFRCIARHWNERKERYTVWQLVDDYENRRIVFEGQEQKITTTLRTLLSEPMAQDRPEFQRAVRFLVVFPEGASKEVAQKYGVWKAIDELANTWGWLGTHIYETRPGVFALTSLRRFAEGIDRLTELLRRFRNKWWHHLPEREKWAVGKVSFLCFVLPELFPRRSGGEQTKWVGHPKIAEATDIASARVAEVVLEGSFEGTQHRFPNRRIAIAVSEEAETLARWKSRDDALDLSFRFFLLDLTEDVPSAIETARGEPMVDFRLNLQRHYNEYPSDLQIFRDIMSPQHCNALVLLNLAMFVWAEMQRQDIPEADRQRLETNLLRPCIRHIVTLTLGEPIKAVGITAKGVGQTLLEHIFAQKCEELYPDYLPLLTGRQSENDLKRYQTVLLKGGLPRSEKQGTRPKVMSREELAKRFDVPVTQLDALVNRLESMGLLKVKEMRELGERKLKVTFCEHPLERKLREWVRERGSEITVRVSGRSKKVKCLDRGILSTLARRWGAHFEEVNAALELAKVRGSLDYDERKVWEAVAEVNPDEIRAEAEMLRKLLEPLRKHFPEDVRHHEKALDEIIALTYIEDEAQWDEARYKLGQENAALKEFVRQKSEQLSKELRQWANELHTMRVKLPTSELERRVELGIRLAEWLDDQRRRLHKDAQKLASDLQRAEDETERLAEQMERVRASEELQPALKRLIELLSEVNKETKENLSQRAEELHALTDGLKAWKALASEADELRLRIPERYGDLRQRWDEWVEGVMEHFAEKQRDALRDHERFEYDLREIQSELAKRAQGERDEFGKLAKSYEQQLMGITDAHLSTPYDPEDPEGSYERLADEVLQKLSGEVSKLGEFLRQDEARIAFLRVIRGLQTSDLEKMWGELEAKLNGLAQGVNLEVIKAFRKGDKRLTEICEALRQWRSQLGELRKKINDADKPLTLDADEEAFLKLVREVAQRERDGVIWLVHLWEAYFRGGVFPPEKLLELVERLYRKGWIDIRLSEQK